jgi:hypothetical protein
MGKTANALGAGVVAAATVVSGLRFLPREEALLASSTRLVRTTSESTDEFGTDANVGVYRFGRAATLTDRDSEFTPNISEQAMLGQLNRRRSEDRLTRDAGKVLQSAQPMIIRDLGSGYAGLSESEVNQIVQRNLTEAAVQIAKEPGSGVTFEVLTLKLKIDSSVVIGGVKITGGEINLGKVVLPLSGGIYACRQMKAKQYDGCVKAVVEIVATQVAKEVSAQSAAGSEPKPAK